MMYDQLYTISLGFFAVSIGLYALTAFHLSQDIQAGRIATRLEDPSTLKK